MDREKARTFVDRFMTFASGATTIGLLAVADRTGLLTTMAGHAPATVSVLAERAGTDPRYTLEILNGLAAAGVVDLDAEGGTYTLSDEHAAVVADDSSPYSMTGWLDMIPAALAHTDRIAEVTTVGGGIPFSDFGDRMVTGIDRGNRPSMTVLLTRRWLPTMPDIVDRLRAGGKVADIGCGSGAAVAAIADAFPQTEVFGFDISVDSVARARISTSAANASFVIAGPEALDDHGPFDLVTALDVIHDLASPQDALESIRASLTPGGTLLMMEPRIAASPADNRNDRAALLYGISTFHCMTQSLAVGGAGLGAAWGKEAARELCTAAGFTTFEELPIDNPFSSFFRVS